MQLEQEPSLQSSTTSLDIVAIGEPLLEFSASSEGQWVPSPSGDCLNTLVYAARMGLKGGLVSALGDDLFTPMILAMLDSEGIDRSGVLSIENASNGLYFIQLDNAGNSRFHYWRHGSAATRTIEHLGVEPTAALAARGAYVLVSGISLAVMGHNLLAETLTRIPAGRQVVLDTNYRAALWPDTTDYRTAIEIVLPLTNIFLPSGDDLAAAWPNLDLLSACHHARDLGAGIVAAKNGAEGAILLDNDGLRQIAPPRLERVVETTGAGDAFNAGLLAGLCRGFTLDDAARLGTEIASRALAVHGAIDPKFQWSAENWDAYERHI